MGVDWAHMSLRDAGVTLIDCVHKTPADAGEGLPYIAIPQMKKGRIDFNATPRLISESDFFEWTKKANPQENDVVLSRRCNPGETAYVPKAVRFALGQNLVLLRSDESCVYPPFLRWLTRGPQWWGQISKFLNVGAVFDSLKCADVPNFELLIPPLENQKSIAHILGTLDDKIELNRKMNEMLEDMARAVFKSWFVDFDPVRAKMEGRQPYGVDTETAALFPDSFENSPLGKIPKGWRVGKLGDVAENPRRTTKPNDIPSNTTYIGLEHMPRRCISLGEWATVEKVTSNKYSFNSGEILFGKLRPYFHKVGVAPVDGVCSTDILVIIPNDKSWYSYVLGTISSDEFIAYTDAASTGTKMPRTNWKDMSNYKVVLPLDAIAIKFHELISPLIKKLLSNLHETKTISSLRDTLLPKLISGEIRIEKAEKFVEQVA